MTIEQVIATLLLLFTKHLIVDFPLQGKYQWSNKGTYGHKGGLLHAGMHGIGTVLVFSILDPLSAIIAGVIDAFVHYHIDWAKVYINKALKWGPTTHEEFWWLLGFDQYLHTLTYISLVFMIHEGNI